MPVESLFVSSTVYALPEADMEDGDYLDVEDIEGINLVLEPGVDFLNMTRQEILDMTLETAAIWQDQVYSSILVMQDRLTLATEIADLIDMAENQEPDWEL